MKARNKSLQIVITEKNNTNENDKSGNDEKISDCKIYVRLQNTEAINPCKTFS